MSLRLYNSLRRRVEDFVPQDPKRVTLYLCGPTVYNYVHIGNARGPVVFGLLVRLLRHRFGADHVRFARNVTDVDDKINQAAAEAGVPIEVITRRYAAAYEDDMRRLGVDPPDVVPYATAHIAEIIAFCRRLIDTGHAYVAADHVLFDVASFPAYGELSGRSPEEMIAGARVEVAPYKKNPADFVLWKPSPPELPGWDSPWGRGRPGWHIECSAMCEAHLGETLDIHAGGNDLLFPHHENEIAQSTCAHGGKPLARYWLHNGMLTCEGRKMSKSLGNTVLLHELLDRYPADLLRYMLLKAHYRQPLDWSAAALAQARATLDGWYGVLRDLGGLAVDEPRPPPAALLEALCDDLNTPAAFGVLAELAHAARRDPTPERKRALLGAGAFLGLLQQDPETWFQWQPRGAAVDPAWVDRLLRERSEARQRRDFATADRIRTELAARGVIIEDSPQGPRWKLADSGAAHDERAA
jgi:cysteinyl-tRNA synthetase